VAAWGGRAGVTVRSRARTRRIRCSSGPGPTCGPCSSTTVCARGRRRPGTAAANLLEAEVVTPDGAVRTANAASNPDLFWALKGGGGGTFGAVTPLTLRTHPRPASVGAVHTMIAAASDAAHATLAGQVRRPAAHGVSQRLAQGAMDVGDGGG